MNNSRVLSLAFLLIGLVASNASAATIQWNGSVSSDVTNPLNWSSNPLLPGVGDVVEIPGGAGNDPDLFGTSPSWGGLNLFASTTITDSVGGGTLNLVGSLANETKSLFSGGTNESSTISVPIVAAGVIRTNGDHDVTFEAAVTAESVSSFATAVSTYNAPLTISHPFTTIGAAGEVVVNDVFNWTEGGAKGLNAGGGTLTFGPASTLNWAGGNGGGVLNVFDGSTVKANGNNVIGQVPDVWSRTASNTLDLNGFSQTLEFLGTNGPSPGLPNGTNLDIDFGATPGANDLVWDASFNSNGTYTVLNFEPGIDKLEFGPFPTPDPNWQFDNITINGVPYAATNPGDGSTVWTTIDKPGNASRQLAVFVPEPASAACVALLLAAGALRRTRETC